MLRKQPGGFDAARPHAPEEAWHELTQTTSNQMRRCPLASQLTAPSVPERRPRRAWAKASRCLSRLRRLVAPLFRRHLAEREPALTIEVQPPRVVPCNRQHTACNGQSAACLLAPRKGRRDEQSLALHATAAQNRVPAEMWRSARAVRREQLGERRCRASHRRVRALHETCRSFTELLECA